MGQILSSYGGLLLRALGQTCLLALWGLFFGSLLGLVFGILGVMKNRVCQVIQRVFVTVIRGIPMMVLAMFVFFGVPYAFKNIIGVNLTLTALQAGCSAVLAAIACFMFEGGLNVQTITPLAWAIILYLAITCTFLGYLMQNLALTRISERTVALLQSLCPVMTAVFALLLLGEHLSAAGIVGAVIIVCCVAAGSVTR